MLAPFAGAGDPVEMTAGYASIVGGAMLWWLGLTYVINKMSNNFGDKGVQRLNRIVGILVLFFALIYALMTICNISFVG